MSTEWMGRYRPLVAALVQHTNIVQRTMSAKTDIVDGIRLTPQEWQVFEYIIEHLNDDAHMNLISERLGIPQSSFSKMVKVLCGYGLIDKYQMTNNRKNIILRPSDYGLEVYARNSSSVMDSTFADFFSQLDPLGDEDIALFTQALEKLSENVSDVFHAPSGELVKMD